jgi:2-oxoglutarate/2-oxoacid ferredoxin oxidoreductase subunit alpha
MIGGPQGSGVDSASRMFALACAHGGLNLYGKREYYSNIKGEHSYFQIRVDERRVRSSVTDVHLLATFEPETLLRHLYSGEVVQGGAVLYDPADLKAKIEKMGTLEPNLREEILKDLAERGKEPVVGSLVEDAKANGLKLFELPYNTILEDVGKEMGIKEFAKLQIVKNVLAVGASFGALDYDLDAVLETVDHIFASKSENVKKMNRLAIEKAYRFVQDTYGTIDYQLKSRDRKNKTKRLFLTGSQASALGKIAAGCRFQTYYPITPATDESEFLEGHAEGKVVVMQCEDEISAAAMATGAALTGVRASTSTSGPGFCLMTEVQGWAGINEVPIVIVNYQRGGPSTGLPTRHEQGDLKFTLNSGHGDYPRIVIAPGDLEESFWGMIDAFNWADQYQTAVVYLSDKNLANNYTLTEAFDFKKARINRGHLLTDKDIDDYEKHEAAGVKSFLRFQFTDNGVSPRTVLGQRDGIHWLTGDEHTPMGHISEDPENRIRMMDKRMGKLDLALKEIPANKKIHFEGPADAQATIVSWGSNKGIIQDAMHVLKEEGINVNFLHIILMAPFPTAEVEAILKKAKTTILVEQNYTAQLGGWIRQNTGYKMDHEILKYTGRPMTEDELVNSIRKILKGESKKGTKEVLTHGV